MAVNRSEMALDLDWDFFGTWCILMRSSPYWAITGLGVLGIVCRDVSKSEALFKFHYCCMYSCVSRCSRGVWYNVIC